MLQNLNTLVRRVLKANVINNALSYHDIRYQRKRPCLESEVCYLTSIYEFWASILVKSFYTKFFVE